jgi:hypothetical protein
VDVLGLVLAMLRMSVKARVIFGEITMPANSVDADVGAMLERAQHIVGIVAGYAFTMGHHAARSSSPA